MGKNSPNPLDFSSDPRGDSFPPTDEVILKHAAQGEWGQFLKAYLAACWKEVLIRCRQQGLQLADTEDLFQELFSRVLRDGTFQQETQAALAELGDTATFRGNLAARYLRFRNAPFVSARFRTFLKEVIKQTISDELRKRRTRTRNVTELGSGVPEVAVDESVHYSVDRDWIQTCLTDAVRSFRVESSSAATKGRRRWFEILSLSIVDAATPGEIADRLGLDRSTIAEALPQARAQFVARLQQVTGIESVTDLKLILMDAADSVRAAFHSVSLEHFTIPPE